MGKRSSKEIDNQIQECVLFALGNLGLNDDFLNAILLNRNVDYRLDRNGKFRYSKISAADYMWLCNFLFMPYDWTPDRWLKDFQIKSVGDAIMDGTFHLPFTSEVRAMLNEYWKLYRSEVRHNKRAYGSPLLDRVISDRRKNVHLRSKKRKINCEQHAKIRDYFENLLNGKREGQEYTIGLMTSLLNNSSNHSMNTGGF